MAFIEKKDPVVLNIRLTSKGRELLSKGRLNFSYYTIGDSEMDYEFNENAKLIDSSYDPFNNSILRPTDKNPDILSFITRSLSGDPYNVISSVPSTQTIIENDINSLGFFQIDSGDTASFITDSDHVKQPDAMVEISGVTGGTKLFVKQAPTYQGNANEPAVNDLILVRWTNPNGIDTTGYTINKDYPTPMLFYRIEEIVGGSLAGNNLYVRVDRPLPNFYGSGDTLAGALVYYNQINYTGDTCFSTDETDDALIAFLQNCQCPTVRFPFWNMSIIFTEEIVGVQPDDKKIYQFNTRGYAGFVSYIQQQVPTYKKLGVIHYTNNSVANTYAEELFYDIDDPERRPTLNIPLVMWHKSSGATLGLKLKATGTKKILFREGDAQVDQEPTSLNTTYYDLADSEGNVVGKVFTDLKVFVIEDQELLFAMSYKSNRSWTLPNYGVDINANVTFGCPDCVLTYQTSGITPTINGGSDGMLYIYNINNFVGDPTKGQLLLEVQASGASEFSQIYFNKITGDTYISGLTAGTYITYVTDLGSPNCTVSGETEVNNPSSVLGIYDTELTQSLLNPDFPIENLDFSPTTIKIFKQDVGDFIGSGYTAVVRTGVTVTDGNFSIFNIPTPGALEQYNNNSLTFKEVYVVYVRDVTGSTVSEYIGSGDSTVWRYYVAVGSPFKTTLTIIASQDSGGNYITVTDYLTAINPRINPIIGEIEFSLYRSGEVALDWQTSNKIYFDWISGGNNNFILKIRERVGTAIAAEIVKSVDLSAPFTPIY